MPTHKTGVVNLNPRWFKIKMSSSSKARGTTLGISTSMEKTVSKGSLVSTMLATECRQFPLIKWQLVLFF